MTMATEIEQGFIPVEGGRVCYRRHGGDRPGTPLLLVHGGPGANQDYLEPLAALADQRPVIFYDQLGGGDSDQPGDPGLWTVERFVAELGQVRQALGLERLFLLGQSWGTVLAVEHALAQGTRGLAGLILSAPCLSAPRWGADQRAWLAELPAATRRAIESTEAVGDYDSSAYQEAMQVYYQRHVCRLEPWPECLERCFGRLSTAIYNQMWGPSEFTITGSLRDYDICHRLGELSLPVLYTCGEFDEATPATTAWYASLTPGSRLAVLAGASHVHHLEAEAEFLALARGFMAEVESGR